MKVRETVKRSKSLLVAAIALASVWLAGSANWPHLH